jgi:hypothetical protein
MNSSSHHQERDFLGTRRIAAAGGQGLTQPICLDAASVER